MSISMALAWAAAPAAAQNVDWVLNLDDTGFDPIAAGGTVSYSVTVSNNGFSAAPATTVDITVPATTSLVAASGTITACAPVPQSAGGTVTCTVPALAAAGNPGDSANVVLDVLTTASGTVTLAASVPNASGATVDTNTANNNQTEGTTVVAGSDVGVSVAGPPTAAAGSTVSYTFTVTNNGPDTLTAVDLQVPAPAGLTGILAPAGCSLAAGTYTCTVATPIATGASTNLVFSGQIAVAAGSTITPVGSVINASPSDPITANNTATTNTSVTAGSDVRITKTRSPSGALLTGDAVTFTLAASYTGDTPTGLTIVDAVPANYQIDTVTPAGGWACLTAGNTVTCTLAAGGAAGANVSLGSITIDTTILSAGNPLNSATISSTGPTDPNLANNSDDDGGASISDPTVDLQANKSGPSPSLVVVGNSYSFPISVTNAGNADFVGTLVLTDALPAQLDVTGYTLNGWTCGPAAPVSGPATVTCQRVYTAGAPLAAGATTPAAVLTATPTSNVVLVNSVTASSPDANYPDTNPANDVASYTVTASFAANAADVSVNKSASPATVAAGDVLTYSIEIVNAGPQPSTAITLTDTLSNLINNSVGATGAGLVSVSESAGVATGLSCSTSSAGSRARALSCSITTLPVCTAGLDCPVVTVAVRPGGNGGNRTNSATAISSGVADPDASNNTGTAAYTVEARADVTVFKSDSPDPATAGQNLTYVVTARNLSNGLSRATAVTVTDTLPDDLTFVSATPSNGSCSTTPTAGSTTAAGNNTVTCNLGNISNGAQRTITIVVRPNNATAGLTITNQASVTTTTTETDLTNNSVSEPTDILTPSLDLLVNKVDTIDPVAVLDPTAYTLTVTNLGPSAAEYVVVTDTLPVAGLSYQSHVAPAGGSCGTVPAPGSFGGTLQCTVPSLAAGQSRTITVNMRGEAKGTYTNSVTVTSDESTLFPGAETNLLNNAASEDTTVRTRADVEVRSKVPSANPVNIRDDFTFVITVANNAGPGRAEADNVTVTDSLPANMELTGAPSVTVTVGSASASSCTGAAGGTSFSCDLGTFTSGAVAEITVPVQLVAVSALPQTFTNTATISTSSLDEVPGNNSGSGSVSVNSSSISGTVFRDFADDGAVSAGDTGVSGVTMTLTGTSFDGAAISTTATTAADGSFTFPFIPQGTYTISRGAPGEPYLTNGTTSAGTAGGTVASATQVTGIALPSNTAATAYLFPLIPQARVGIAKDVQSGPTPNADGSFNVTFRMRVENLSLETLQSVTVTDTLAGGAPLFGSHATLAVPATDTLARGAYTLLAAPSGSCGGLNAGFDGAADTTLASGFSIAAGAICTIDINLRVQPTVPFPPVQASGGRYENQAAVTATGALSGQTSATNPQLTDLSDDGTNADPDSDGQANEAGENDPTPVTPVYNSAIALVKAADTSALSTPPLAGETLGYTFTVTNTGDVTLSGITLSDPLPGIAVSGGPIASLAPGASDAATFTATYVLTQADIDAGSVTNQATATGTDPFGATVSDPSGTTVANDVALTTPLTAGPAIALTKSATPAFSAPPQPGDLINYAFAVTNTGNVTLSNVTLSDPLPGIAISGGPIASLAPGATDAATFTATYALTQADIDTGSVTNQATATGTPPSGPDVSDLSGTTAGDDLPTNTAVTQAPAIQLVKSVDATDFDDGPDPGDVLRYSFAITNTGNVTLVNVTLSDPLPGLALVGGPIASLAPGATDTATFSGTYAPTAADIAAGSVNNTATATGSYGPGATLSVSDSSSVSATVVSVQAIAEVFPPFATDGGTTTSMLASDLASGGPAVLYAGGPVTPQHVTLAVIAQDPGVTLDTATALITLAPGQPAGDYTVTYEICSAMVPTVCDQATETVNQLPLPGIEATKTQVLTDNGDGIDGVGDLLTYTIAVENTGNVPLTGIALSDTFTSLAANALVLDSGPTFVSASLG